MVEHKAPSEGQKVDLGENAPSRQEATGKVPSGSLANESAQHGGTFSENRGVESSGTENAPSSKGSSKLEKTSSNDSESYAETAAAPAPKSSSKTSASTGSSGDASAAFNDGHEKHRHQDWPHGKNLHEGIDYKGTEDGTQKAMKAQLGSQDDPARLAEQQFIKQNELKAAGATGMGQMESDAVDQGSFGKLKEEQA